MGDSSEPCHSDAVFAVSGDLTMFTWGSVVPVCSLPELHDQRSAGVYAYDRGNGTLLVRVIGVCPNWSPDGCRAGENCLGRERVRERV